jgi:acyl dehydratase
VGNIGQFASDVQFHGLVHPTGTVTFRSTVLTLCFSSSVCTAGHLHVTVNGMVPAVDWNVAVPLASDEPCTG